MSKNGHKGYESEAVKLWRDKFKLNLSSSWKRDVEITVTDLDLWQKILDGWRYRDDRGHWHTRHPGIKGLLDEYERLKADAIRQESGGVHRAESVPERVAGRMSEQRVPVLLARESGWK